VLCDKALEAICKPEHDKPIFHPVRGPGAQPFR
jgi:hypothetical protein